MLRKSIVALLLVSSLSGCMGNGALRAKALKWNLTTAESRWGREFLFLGMVVVPVYPICTVLDMLVFNSIEFWSGTNPINGKSPLVDIPRSEIDKLGLDQVDVVQIERLDETRANLYVAFESGDRVTFDVVRDRDTYSVSYAGIEFFRGRLSL
jgi:hypothetical protein